MSMLSLSFLAYLSIKIWRPDFCFQNLALNSQKGDDKPIIEVTQNEVH